MYKKSFFRIVLQGQVVNNPLNLDASNVTILIGATFGQDLVWIYAPVVQISGAPDYNVKQQQQNSKNSF